MAFKPDIIQRINEDFGSASEQALTFIQQAIDKRESLNTDRVIRCIIFLSAGDLNSLQKNIEIATLDPRDVMFQAEYEGILDIESAKRIRDFNSSFDDCAKNVKQNLTSL